MQQKWAKLTQGYTRLTEIPSMQCNQSAEELSTYTQISFMLKIKTIIYDEINGQFLQTFLYNTHKGRGETYDAVFYLLISTNLMH